MIELRIHGRGGQGVVTMAELLARAALKAGMEAQTLPFFGVERRGAAVKACVRMDDAPIKLRSMSYHPQFLALMQESLLPYARLEGFAADTVVITNGNRPIDVPGEQWLVDAQAIALNNNLVFGGEAYINVPMLGAIARVLELPLPRVEEAVSDQWPGAKGVPNLAACREAYAQVKKGGKAHA